MDTLENTSALTLPQSTERVDTVQGSIFFVGTATVILRYAGFTILTDPNFLHQGDHVHLGGGLTSARLTNPAIDMEQLPPFDLVLLSHMHEDHFDRMVQKKLDKGTAIVTTPQATTVLRHKCFTALEPLHTWETLTVTKGDYVLRITAMPGKHGPGIMNAMLPSVMGSMLEFQNRAGKTLLRLYITGDTLMHEHLQEIPQRYPDIDLALLHLGGTRIFGILLTMDAMQGIEAVKLMNARKNIPLHYNDYPVFKSPLADFKALVTMSGLEDRVHYMDHGGTYTFEVPDSRH
ncbi:MAG: MBL fold metallo-hydrolase [Ktedonobacteraceae bacterium]